jgi:cell division protein FtsB
MERAKQQEQIKKLSDANQQLTRSKANLESSMDQLHAKLREEECTTLA